MGGVSEGVLVCSIGSGHGLPVQSPAHTKLSCLLTLLAFPPSSAPCLLPGLLSTGGLAGSDGGGSAGGSSILGFFSKEEGEKGGGERLDMGAGGGLDGEGGRERGCG